MTTSTTDALLARLQARFEGRLESATVSHGTITLEIQGARIREIGTALRDDPQFDFAQLSDLCGVDYLSYGEADWVTEDATSSGFSRAVGRGAVGAQPGHGERFAVVYHLLSLSANRRLRLRAWVGGEPPAIASVVDIWPSANWFEREAFDLFGILFDGHPDLRRILTDYGFIGHPFRKDFPLEGYVEMRYDPDKGRVVYQPVSIDNRVLVPRVIRDDSRYAHPQEGGASA
ncbi:MAG: NADH-quinone oxidoreductase subunit C [Gammaproteobacteria bacterium]|nr:NADH-quinone oxidoreductase subunit C [Gammaproteobacteria bacterium]